ncbi:helix-turn-helix transcriptional regulator [Burkholderia gladioli]|uniref:helix-turn-helix transcriptional regulator n=1 Tax=Burkholderia gladioli TaxID=28095 RepID=UPI00163E11BE|nr:helix-turn-helix transcriptional regulator [Burkholderia gladioli]
MNLAEWLKLSRERAKLTLEQIGELVNRSKGAISQWENGKTDPSYWQVLKVYERTNRAVPLPTLSDAPIEIGRGAADEWLGSLSPSARKLIDAVANADGRNVSPSALDAITTLLQEIPGADPDDGDELRL